MDIFLLPTVIGIVPILMHSWVELTIIVSTIDPSLAKMEHRYLLIIPGFVLINCCLLFPQGGKE